MEPGSPIYIVVMSCLIMVLILISLCGNLLVVLGVYLSRTLRTKINFMIVSLAVADIMIALISMPLWMHFQITNYGGLEHSTVIRMVYVTHFFDVLGGVASIANLTAISYERLWSVCAPLKHRRYLTPRTVSVVLFFVWLYAIIVASSSVILWEWKWVTWFTVAAAFLFPLFLTIVAYFFIFITVLRSPRNVISQQDNVRISKTICIIIGVFVACWAPFMVTSVLSTYSITFHKFFVERLWLGNLLKALHYANSCVNPVVYGIANAQYKEAYKLVLQKIFLSCLPKRNVTVENPMMQTKPRDYTRNYGNANRPSSKQILCETQFIKDEKSNTSSRDGSEDPYLPGDYRAIPVLGATAPDVRWMSAGSAESTNVLIKSINSVD